MDSRKILSVRTYVLATVRFQRYTLGDLDPTVTAQGVGKKLASFPIVMAVFETEEVQFLPSQVTLTY